jgi:hypothetical protein
MSNMMHHPEGPSLHPAFSECADFTAQAEIDDLEAGEAADEEAEDAKDAKARGTAQHAALALYIEGSPHWDAGLTRYERANVEWVARKAIDVAEVHGFSRSDMRCEQRVNVFGPDLELQCFGTLDIEFGPFTLDAKFGLERNYFPQGSAYCLGRFQRDGTTRGYFGTIYGMLRRYVQQAVTIETAQTVTWGILSRRHADLRKPTPCSYCGWCSKRATCSAFTAPTLELMQAAPDWRAMMAAVEAAPLDVRLGFKRLIAKEYLQPYIDRITEECQLAPDVVPLGFRKGQRAGRATISDQAKAIAAMKDAGVRDSDLVAVSGFTTAEFTAAFQFRFPKCSDEDARKEVIQILTKAEAYNPGKPSSQLTKLKGAEQMIRSAINQLSLS